ncbi:MAG TPA: xanthine dehydrogenase family protein molybdopterin-binding subunit [Rhizomicrobium sp.]|nr:xanthine dehydrogenase family protein molybdopterin-binding subunit [Rhizomicrobium sp.]
MKFGIGQPVRRHEDAWLVTGTGRYTDDISLFGQTYAYVLRSPVAHARLRRVDGSAVRAMPGVLLVLTGDDVIADGLGNLPCIIPLNNRDGTPRHDTPRPILATDKVRYAGQPVALVVAETLNQARDAAEAIDLAFDELPSVVESAAALKPGAPQLFEHISGNLVVDWQNECSDAAAVDAAFAGAAHVTKIDIVNNRVVVNSMESRNAIADFDAATDRSTLYTCSQGPHTVRDPIADIILKLSKEKLRVITPNVGGGFGTKLFPYPEQALAVWASRKLKRPVKWQADRSEGFLADNQGRDHRSHAELALDAMGKFLALRVTVLANLGAYLSPVGVFVPTRSTDLIAGLYTTPVFDISVKCVCTNTVPVCAYRGAGRPEAAYLMERLVDAAARDMKMSPDAIRRVNFVPPTAMPFKTGTRFTFDSGEFEKLMSQCIVASDWSGFAARRAETERHGKLRGIGMATYTERCGGGIPETASIEFKGGRIDLVMGNQEFGTGLVTAYKQIVSDRLGIDADLIDVVMGDTDRTPSGITGGSRGVPVGGSALFEASKKVIDKGKQIAAHLLETASVDIAFEDATFRVAGTDLKMDLFDVARAALDSAKLPPGMEPGLDVTHFQLPEAETFPNGCHIVEVEIDPDTGTVAVARYTVVDDFGRTINPLTLEGQVHGGIVQGLGQALYEHTVYDEESGQLLSGSFMDYCMPRADNFPSFSFATRNVRSTANPLGIKGAGEAGAIGAPPAIMNAIVDALHRRVGIRNIDMPATPIKVWRMLHAGPTMQA